MTFCTNGNINMINEFIVKANINAAVNGMKASPSSGSELHTLNVIYH